MNIDAFNKNVSWNLEQIAVQVGHAEKVKGRARSGYYKAAIILAASIVEALAYKILESNFMSAREVPMSTNGTAIERAERLVPTFYVGIARSQPAGLCYQRS